MQMHEALQKLRTKKGVKIVDLHNTIKKMFGENALCYRTLLRILYGQTTARDTTIHQICIALGVTPAELKEMTAEGHYMDTVYLKRSRRKKRYVYNQKAFADVLSGPERKFSIIELTLTTKGVTKVEKRADKKETIETWVYGVRSVVTCTVEDKEYRLKKGDCIAFDGNLEHSFENKTPRKAQCLILQSNQK